MLADGALDGVSAGDDEDADLVAVDAMLDVDRGETAATATLVAACVPVVDASTATRPVLSAAAAAVAWVILTMRRLAAFRAACRERASGAGALGSGVDAMPPSNGLARRSP